MSLVCPLGFCRTEEDCPHAPCLDCMRRLGEHMIQELGIIDRQTRIARARGDITTATRLGALTDIVSLAISQHELK